MYNTKIKAFAEIDSFSAEKKLKNDIREYIEGKSKEYILGVDEEEFLEYVINKYTIEPLKVFQESEKIDTPTVRKKKNVNNYFQGYEYEKDVYYFNVHYKFSGSSVLFKIQPNPWTMTTYEIAVNNTSQEVTLSFKIFEQDAEKFKREKSQIYRSAFTNLEGVNVFANQWNSSIRQFVTQCFNQVKNKFLKENDFFSAINISTNSETESIFSVPAIKKVTIPQPIIDKKKEFSSVPTMAMTMYTDILKVIYDAGKSMEKKPSLYTGKDEEGLRDQFLFILETRYKSVTATGETFNKQGKTDIILKYCTDNTNVFVAECKFWKGAIEFHKAINQLFDRYLTWRDSKVALIFFVTNKDFTQILTTADTECLKHKYFISKNGTNGESSFSYKFRLPADNEKEIYLELILFHFDEK